MGLDMYLTKHTYIGAEHEHQKVEGKIDISIKGNPVNINFNRVRSIVESVGYWRKANQIHNWFVQNVQGGEDDHAEHHVSRKNFESLLADIKTVLNAKGTPEEEGAIEDLLPPTSGFFFGSTDVDEWYWKDLEDTKTLIENLLLEMDEDQKNPNAWNINYYYEASW